MLHIHALKEYLHLQS